jgi:hypothetical protein
VGNELEAITREAAELSAWMARPNVPLRMGVAVAVVALVSVVLVAAKNLYGRLGPQTWSDGVQGLEALINDVVFVGVAVYFLVGIEVRQKRKLRCTSCDPWRTSSTCTS